MNSSNKAENLSFEESMQELEALVKQMEAGDLPLEQALSSFERGVTLARNSQQKLKQAEQKVQVLMEQNGQQDLVPLENTDPE